jgi:chromate reductase, NAD(P)H dehydrogenase (quinone)
MPARRVALVLGSLSRHAMSGRAAAALKRMAPPTLQLSDIPIGGLPFYNADLETDNPPAPWAEFRKAVRDSDAVLFVTPEYNRGVPGALKNAIDVGSRPSPQSVWNGKPVGIVSTSPSPIGGFGANHQLRQNISYFGMHLLHQPEMYVSHVNKGIDADGNFLDDKLRELFEKYLAAYASWVETTLMRKA